MLGRLRSAPTGLAGPLEEEAKGEAVLDLVAVLKTLVEHIRKLTSAVEQVVAQVAVGQLMMSFPRAGRVNAIRILARAWIRVLWRCWHDGKHYDVALHHGASAIAADQAVAGYDQAVA